MMNQIPVMTPDQDMQVIMLMGFDLVKLSQCRKQEDTLRLLVNRWVVSDRELQTKQATDGLLAWAQKAVGKQSITKYQDQVTFHRRLELQCFMGTDPVELVLFLGQHMHVSVPAAHQDLFDYLAGSTVLTREHLLELRLRCKVLKKKEARRSYNHGYYPGWMLTLSAHLKDLLLWSGDSIAVISQARRKLAAYGDAMALNLSGDDHGPEKAPTDACEPGERD